jgi:D-3-phosphoglycerate dehydrogenase / 2-oxoglutarate reductase
LSWRVLATPRYFHISPEPARLLREHGCTLVRTRLGGEQSDAGLTEKELVELLRDVDAAIVGTCRVTRQVIAAARRLKLLARRGVGYDSIDVKAATDHGMLVTIAPGAVDAAVADHAFALMLAAARSIPEGHKTVTAGAWDVRLGTELWRKTLGVVGMGRIGKAVARRAAGFEMNVLAYDVFRDLEFARNGSVRYVELPELLQSSDFISINVSLSDATRHLIGVRELRSMKRSAILVNTSRGPVVVEQALSVALREGRIRAAGIDTFEEEPPLETPLRGLENAVLSPHAGGYTTEGMARANQMAAQAVVAGAGGGMPPTSHVVNPGAWPDGHPPR